MAGEGTVKSAGYRTGGQVPFRGMKNKRKAAKKKLKDAEMRLKRQREMEEEERARQYSDDFGFDYNDNRGNYRGNRR